MGPESRTPEAKLYELIEGGITTLVGLRGTDDVSRSLENLLTKLRGLENEGLTTFMWSGSYTIPTKTLIQDGDIKKDIMLIDKIIGVKGCLSDHRSSIPSIHKISKLISDCRVGGLISGKAGKAYFHVGNDKEKLNLLFKIVNETSVPINSIYLTHMGRNKELLIEGEKWIRKGGYIDFTSDSDYNKDQQATNALLYLAQNEQNDFRLISISSDSYGSFPKFDRDGNLISYSYGKPNSVFLQIKKLIKKHNWSIEKAFSLATSNISNFLKFKKKGELKEKFDADILIIDFQSFDIDYVLSRGEILKNTTWIKKGMFD